MESKLGKTPRQEDNYRIQGRIPGVDRTGNGLPFRPEEDVLAQNVMKPSRVFRTARFEPNAHVFSGRSAIAHMDTQYEGTDPDSMLSGEAHEATVFQASDLSGTVGE